jgi:agmatinase
MGQAPDVHFEPPLNFGGLPDAQSGFTDSPVVIVPIPLEQTTSYRGGSRDGPAAIIQASRFMELLDPDTGKVPADLGIHTLPALEPRVSGVDDSLVEIERVTRWLLENGKKIGALGGEHSLTYPVVRAHRDRFPRLSVLQLDAHADLRPSYQGSVCSHASVMHRIVEMEIPTVGLGIRSLSEEEHRLIRDRRLSRYSGRDVVRRRVPLEEMLKELTDQVYVTLDLDGFDPSEVPGVGTPEPGGFGWFDFEDILDALKGRQVVGFDVVELMPLPGQVASDFLAARAVYALIGALFRPEGQ